MRPGEGAGRTESYATGRFRGYALHDPLDRRIGCIEQVFVDGGGKARYVEVRIGLFGARSVLIPVKAVVIDEERRTVLLR